MDDDIMPYEYLDDIDFSIITMGLKYLPFYEDDLYLGMQAMNSGLADCHVTQMEYELLRTYIEIEKTPTELALTVGALSQMWAYGTYEVLRMWRDRMFSFRTWRETGGIASKIESLEKNSDDLNLTTQIRKRQLQKYMDDEGYRLLIDNTWKTIEPAYRSVEFYRINLAKHCAPGKDNIIPRAPGYGRINMYCGSLDYELIGSDGIYETLCRRDLADCIRNCIKYSQQDNAPEGNSAVLHCPR